jgi:hypothetical protein
VPAQTTDARDLKPPLHLRCVIFHADIVSSILEAKSSGWFKSISHKFRHVQQRKEWKLEIVGKGETLKPRVKLDLIPVQERHDDIGRVTGDITSYTDKVMLRLQRQGAYLGTFEELHELASEFVPVWKETFGIERFKGVELIYANLLCKEYTPALIVEKDGLQRTEVGRTLTLFNTIPGKYKDMRPPYRAEMTSQIADNTLFTFQVNDLPSGQAIGGPHGNAIQVTFGYQRMSPNKPLDFQEAMEEVTKGHELLLEQFTEFFTAEARELFK